MQCQGLEKASPQPGWGRGGRILNTIAQSFRVLLSSFFKPPLKYKRNNEKDSGLSTKMTPSCKWPIQIIKKLNLSYISSFFLARITKRRNS